MLLLSLVISLAFVDRVARRGAAQPRVSYSARLTDVGIINRMPNALATTSDACSI